MDVVYLVKAYFAPSHKEKTVLYNGLSAKKAFDLLEVYNEKSEITVEIYEGGNFVKEFKK